MTGYRHRWAAVVAGFALLLMSCRGGVAFGQEPLTLEQAAARVVKLHGAGGIGRVEGYGSGILVSPEGHVLTALSPMLDASGLKAILADGRRVAGKVEAVDPERQLALVRIEAAGLPHFALDAAKGAKPQPADAVFALANPFEIAAGAEAVSVFHATIAAIAPLQARQGQYEFTYPGKVYVLDATTNNPGAAGGALIDVEGTLVGMVGKELRNTQTETWINYAVPASEFVPFVEAVLSGEYEPSTGPPRRKPLAGPVDLRGLLPLPAVLDETPPYVDGVEPGSPAATAGLRPDDLVMFVAESLIRSLADLESRVARIPLDEPIELTVLRDGELRTVTLPPRPEPTP